VYIRGISVADEGIFWKVSNSIHILKEGGGGKKEEE